MHINHEIGLRIAALRKELGYTQEQISVILNVTPQAVSKWEKGNALPDIALLPQLAKTLAVSIDRLLTGGCFTEKTGPYDGEYKKEEYYWGTQHSLLAEQVVDILQAKMDKRLLDIGSGEGRDAVYFSQSGFLVDALEISTPGVEKIRQYSQMSGHEVNILHADMIGYELRNVYDVIYSHGSLQFLPVAERQNHFDRYKRHTSAGGLNAHLIFVEKPFIKMAPDWEKNEYFYLSGDLARYYHDWEILHCEEQIIECNSAGIPHRHAVSSIIARKTEV
ncbi:helix-turn-helix domain-containing protein [Sporomusa acidovorans]|uniref:HTH cro/C1-type domain-containing protein n=1 Tax=Sporomusa acidovorans (strain ATCC 49682 / DSM 3132 / Mol) TaxID=1123286 RepID=A0ABZ3J4Z5_SPOA4|nr:helix-turn-helix domain-containing protein [Sporomusa acidovorans]OZC18239.1 tellurite methyltransferase [Sporomusa acidovorans DSM 3132]SDF25641.1 tellurite methyltransferase [Sporomusa acidovorans]